MDPQVIPKVLRQGLIVDGRPGDEAVRGAGREVHLAKGAEQNDVGQRFLQLAPIAAFGRRERSCEGAVGGGQGPESLGFLAILALAGGLHPLHDEDAEAEQHDRHAEGGNQRQREGAEVFGGHEQLHSGAEV